MPKTCWYCEHNNEQIADDFLGDFDCEECGMENDVMDKNKPDWKPENSVNEEEKMAHLGDLRKNLVKEDVQTGDVILFVDAGEIKDVDFSKTQDGSDGKTVFQVMVELPDGKNKIYTPNATTRSILSDVWTEDTENWIGKKAIVKFIDQLSFGKLVKILILEPIAE